MSKELRIIILAAGKGTRMNSDLPKVLHKLNGKTLLDFVLDESELLNPKETILVVGFKKEQVISHTQHRANLKYATQMEQLGTGHAVLQTGDSNISIGDDTLRQMTNGNGNTFIGDTAGQNITGFYDGTSLVNPDSPFYGLGIHIMELLLERYVAD